MKTTILTILLASTLLSGCFATMPGAVTEVLVPVPVPCNINAPSMPSWPFQTASGSDDIFTSVKKMLAEIELRKGYEIEMEAAIKGCNSRWP